MPKNASVLFPKLRLLVTVLILVTHFQQANAQLKVDFYMTEGKRAIAKKAYPEAIQYFNSIIASYDNLYEAFFFRGVAKFSLGDFIGAEQDFNQAIEIKPYYPKAYHYRALTKDRLKQFHLALQDYNKAIDQEPNSAHTYINRGIAKVLLKYYYSAIEDCEYSIKLNANLENSYLCLGLAKMGLEQYEDAIIEYNKALRFDEFNEDTYIKRGIAKRELKDYQESLSDFNTALSLDSINTFAIFNRALLYGEMEEKEKALKDYNKVISLEPENAIAYFNRAILYSQQEKYKAAISDYNTVESLSPNNVLTYFNRALLRFRLKDERAALSDLNKAIEIFPDFGEAYYNRAIVKRSEGDMAGAQADYNKAAYLNEKYKEVSFNNLDINKFIELDADFDSKRYNRDKLQHKFVDIKLKENFVISFNYGADDKVDKRKTYFYNPLLAYNKNHENSSQFILVNEEIKLSPDDIYTLLNILDEQIEQDAENAGNYFNRAVLKGRIEDYNGAIEDYNKAIALDENLLFAYFGRANIRVDLIDLLNSFSDNVLETEGSPQNRQDIYNKVLNDFTKVLELDPEFTYAWHNRANFKVFLDDIDGALEDYSKAVETSKNLNAESYFNRALILIYKKENKKACVDLGKAGELGINEAYNIIKRYCNK